MGRPSARAGVREPAGNLPADVTSFVGRRREITLAKRLLAESRLLTLTGPGGVGKTRLALRVAANMRRSFKDKTWYVGLEDLRDPALLVETVSEQLDLGVNESNESKDIIEQLKNREMLLVLDNCEHLVDEVALLVDALLRACPGIRVLATSRQSLGVAGETTLAVPPLQVPDLEHLPPPEAYEQYASVRLFAERARAVLPEFEVDEENGPALLRLCHHLDGNPLAIELAAVRLRSLSLQQLDERLTERYELLTEGRRGAPSRQQTLRALIDWSYDLCSALEKSTWARISVFSGSFELDAAEHVAGAGLNSTTVLGAVHALVDKSVLLREEEAGEVRYRLVRLHREYGLEKLAASGEHDEVADRHLRWYADMVVAFVREWVGPNQVSWVERLHLEQSNIREALRTSRTLPDTDQTGLRMAAGLLDYWGIRGLYREALHWLGETLSVTTEPSVVRGQALRSFAWFSLLLGENAEIEPTLRAAADIAEELDDEVGRTYQTQIRAMRDIFRGRVDLAVPLLEETVERFHALGVLRGELFGLFSLGLAKGLGDDRDGGRTLLERCVARTSELGELFWRSYALWAIAQIELHHGAWSEADLAAKEALRLQRRLRNQLATAFSLSTLARSATQEARYERAAKLLGAAAATWDTVRAGHLFFESLRSTYNEHEATVRSSLGEETYTELFNRGYQLSFDTTMDYALEIKKTAGSSTSATGGQTTPLTRREREIAELVAQGRTNKEIAESLVIAQRTVEGHVQHILTKLDFSSRAQIAGWIAGRQSAE